VPEPFNPDLLKRLLDHTEVATYRAGERIIEEGAPNDTIYIIRQGLVRVEHSRRAGVGLVQLGPGDVIGEMAFLQGLPASASVFADEEVDVLALRRSRLAALLQADPPLVARLYEALAVMLAGKLRDTTDRLTRSCPPAMIAPPHRPRMIPPGLSDRDLPQELLDAMDAFEVDLLKVEQSLRYRDFTGAHAQARVDRACDALTALLDRPPPPDLGEDPSNPAAAMGRDPALWGAIVGDFAFRRSFPHVLLSSLMRRCHLKPRGAAVDFETREQIERNQAEGNGILGPYLDRWFLSSAVCRSLRDGRERMSATLLEVATRGRADGPVRVTSLASGTARELLEPFRPGRLPGVDLHATCVDVDHLALVRAMELARERGCLDHFRYFQCHPVYLAKGQESIVLPPQDVIYSLGLAEYLDDDSAIALLDWSHDRLAEGGVVALTNLDPPRPLLAFMEQILDWTIQPRDEDRVRTLFRRSRLGDRGLELRRDASGADVFAISRKTPS
jgi:extracellular factor (EF) 3-hydroxypalmitic acid methyl ester biosynthesis protein